MNLADIPNPTNRVIAARLKRQGGYDHVFMFTPTQDITAFELAMIIAGTEGTIAAPIGVMASDLEALKPYARHYTEIEFD